MGEPPDAVHAEEPEDVLHAEARLEVGCRDRRHPHREEQRGAASGDGTVVLARERAPDALEDHHLAPLETLDQGQPSEQQSVEVVLPEPRHPRIGGKLVVVHAREGVGVVEVGAVAFVEFQQRVGDPSEEAASLDGDRRLADRRQVGPVADVAHQTVVFGALVQQVGDAGREDERDDRIGRPEILLVEDLAVDRLVLREPHPDVDRRLGDPLHGKSLAVHHRHVAVAVDPLHPGPD